MKSRPLIRSLRVLFGALRIFVIIGLVVIPADLLPFRPNRARTIANAAIAVEPSVLQLAPDFSAAGGTIKMDSLFGRVEFRAPFAADRELRQLEILQVFSVTLLLLLSLLWADTVWRMLRNAEQGEVFSDTNVQLMRRLGVVQLGGSVIISFVIASGNYFVSQFFASRVTLPKGLTVDAGFAPFLWQHSFDAFGGIVFGIFILVLAEVFAQGLALKQEADLTV